MAYSTDVPQDFPNNPSKKITGRCRLGSESLMKVKAYG